MYSKPFGSIFGESPLIKADSAPAPAPLPPPATEEDRNKLLEARKAVQYEELLAPKVPFSNEEPQFRAASTVVSKDPGVILAQSNLSLEKSQIKYATLVRDEVELKNKISAAEVYISVLDEIKNLPQQKQKEVQKFILDNEEKLKKIINTEKAISKSKDIKEATAALNTEIKHWETLDAQKGRVELKSFRPTQRKVSEELPVLKLLPKIGGKSASEQIARLDKHGVAWATGYGDAPIKTDGVISAKPKSEEFYVKYMSKLPDQGVFVKQRSELFQAGRTAKETEKNVLLAQQYEWKSLVLAKKIEKLTGKFNTLQAKIGIKAADLPNQKILTGLSIVVMAKPGQFRSGVLLDNLRVTVSNTTLSGFGDDLPSVVTAGAQEVQTREKVLTNLQTKVVTEPTTPTAVLTTKKTSLLEILLGVGLLVLLLGRK